MSTLHSASRNDGGIGLGAREVTVRHAHYYDAALHRAITETGKETGRRALERAAASAAYRSLAGSVGRDVTTELKGVFASTGLGSVGEISVGPRSAEVAVAPSSYVRTRIEMFGKTKAPVCDVTRGVIAGSLGALFGGTFRVEEVECVSTGADRCRFVAGPADDDPLFEELPPFDWPDRDLRIAPPDEAMPTVETIGGALSAGGASYGHLWAELYARAAHDFEQEIPAALGPKFQNVGSVVLTEAAHLGTFYSVGGLVRSDEWSERVVPLLPTREEWARAIIRLVDSFGWGGWDVQLLVPDQRFTVHVYDGYEALSYIAMDGEPATSPRCYFARGFVAALMNVLFAGDVLQAPALNQTVYNSLFRSPSSFRAIETRCTAMGHPYCEFVANPLSPGMRR